MGWKVECDSDINQALVNLSAGHTGLVISTECGAQFVDIGRT